MRFQRVRLRAPAHLLADLRDFYDSIETGETELDFTAGEGEPFYHFAFLVPGNRFAAALEWIGGRAGLLPDRETGEVVFDFENWDAYGCYFHDPAGNIVELVAHRGIDESDATGPFAGTELLGFSELGLVGDRAGMAGVLWITEES